MYNHNYSNTVFQVNKQSIVTILWLYIKVIDLFHIITEYWVIDNKTVTSVLYTKINKFLRWSTKYTQINYSQTLLSQFDGTK